MSKDYVSNIERCVTSEIRVNASDLHLTVSELKKIISNIINKKTSEIKVNPALRLSIGKTYVACVTKFVPKKLGYLRDSGGATKDGRVYWSARNEVDGDISDVNYASIQYENEAKNYTTPGTHSEWTKYVSPKYSGEWRDFIDKITPIIKEAYKNNG